MPRPACTVARVAAAFLFPLAACLAQAAPVFQVIDLGPLPTSGASGYDGPPNASQQLAGMVGGLATRFQPGRWPKLQSSAYQTEGVRVLDDGTMVVQGFQSGPQTPFVETWKGGVVRQVPGLGGAGGTTVIAANANGDMVGQSQNVSGLYHAWLRTAHRSRDLGVLPGGVWSMALSINATDQAVGVADAGGGLDHAVFWDHGRMVDLGDGGIAGASTSATAINDAGVIVGVRVTPSDVSEVVYFEHGGARVIPGTDANSWVYGLNNLGHMTGYSGAGVAWFFDGAQLWGVQDCLDAGSAGWQVSGPGAPSDDDVFGALGLPPGGGNQYHIVLLKRIS